MFLLFGHEKLRKTVNNKKFTNNVDINDLNVFNFGALTNFVHYITMD